MNDTHHVFHRNLCKDYPIVERAEGVYIWDQSGKRYLDGSGGACVVSIGHAVPEIREAMIRQAEKVPYVHSSHFENDGAIECAERLHRLVPDKSLNKVYFLSGRERNRAAQHSRWCCPADRFLTFL